MAGLALARDLLPSARRGLAGLAHTPRKGWYAPFAPPIRDENAPTPHLAHRRLEVFTRPAGRSQLRRVRRADDWIPAFLQGRGAAPSAHVRVPLAPILEDYLAGRFVLQRRTKAQFVGPLYELLVHPDPEDSSSSESAGPVRALAYNMLVHPVTDKPIALAFVAKPATEPVRVRVPVRYINRERCPGLKLGGWVNQLHRAVDIAVAAGVRPPERAVQDLAETGLRGSRTVGELEFEGKGEGCRAVLPDDTATTIISRVK